MDKTVSVAENFDAVMDCLVLLVQDLKVHKGKVAIVIDELHPLAKAIGDASGVLPDLKDDRKGCLNSAAIAMASIVNAVLED